MELTEDEIIKKYAKRCGHFNRHTLLLYEHGFTCVPCGFNVIRTNHQLTKI